MRSPIAAGILYPYDKSSFKVLFDNIKRPDFNSVSALFLPNAKFEEFKDFYREAYSYLIDTPDSTTFIFLSNNKSKKGKPVAISNEDWLTPFGRVSYDKKMGEEIKKHSSFAEFDNSAHLFDSSIELHLPFIQAIIPKPKMVGITISISDMELVEDLVDAIEISASNLNQETIIISSCGFIDSKTFEDANAKLARFLDNFDTCVTSYDEKKQNVCSFLIHELEMVNPSIFLIPFIYSLNHGFKPRILNKKLVKTGVEDETEVFLSIAYIK